MTENALALAGQRHPRGRELFLLRRVDLRSMVSVRIELTIFPSRRGHSCACAGNERFVLSKWRCPTARQWCERLAGPAFKWRQRSPAVPTAPAKLRSIFKFELCPPMAPRPPIEDNGDIGTSPFWGSFSDKSVLAYNYMVMREIKHNGASRN
jgi:hypothetical protein